MILLQWLATIRLRLADLAAEPRDAADDAASSQPQTNDPNTIEKLYIALKTIQKTLKEQIVV